MYKKKIEKQMVGCGDTRADVGVRHEVVEYRMDLGVCGQRWSTQKWFEGD